MSDLLSRITIDANQCGGRPCIRGMRIRVQDVLDMLAGGASHEDILTDFPYLEPDDIRADNPPSNPARLKYLQKEFNKSG